MPLGALTLANTFFVTYMKDFIRVSSRPTGVFSVWSPMLSPVLNVEVPRSLLSSLERGCGAQTLVTAARSCVVQGRLCSYPVTTNQIGKTRSGGSRMLGHMCLGAESMAGWPCRALSET